jgi:hypothetical protein
MIRVRGALAFVVEVPDLPPELEALDTQDTRRLDWVWEHLKAALGPEQAHRVISWVEDPPR